MMTEFEIKANMDLGSLTRESQRLPRTLGRVGRDGGQELSKGIVDGLTVAQEEMKAVSRRVVEEMENMSDALEEGVTSAVGHMGDAFVEFVQTGKLDFRELVNSIIADLARISFDRFLKDPLEGLFNGLLDVVLGGGNTKGGSSLLSAGLSPLTGGTSSPGKALGGPVSFGRPYVVGERGRELFVPNTSGHVVPNGAMGGGQIVFNVNAADAQSFQRSETQIAAMLNRMVRRGQRNL